MISMLAFHPSQLGIYAVPLAGGGFAPVGPQDILARAGAVAALNGPMFGNCAGQQLPSGNASYAVSQCSQLLYSHYDQGTGLAAPSAHPTQGVTISVSDGKASAASGSVRAPVAVQLYPALVRGGKAVTSAQINPDVVWRSGLAILRDGQLAFAIGRMSMHDFARGLIENGVVEAGYTDGGGSSALVSLGGVVGSGEKRRVPSWLVVRKVGAQASSSGVGTILAVTAGIAAVAWMLGGKPLPRL